MKTEIIKTNSSFPEKEKIEYAAKIVDNGGLVGFPTETVYGIACAYDNDKGKDRLYEIKKRPKNKPFTVHIADIDIIERMGCQITRDAQKIIDKYWPGPVTIILSAQEKKETIGFRMPANKIAYELIKASHTGVVAPSANFSGKRSPICAEDVMEQLDGKIDLLIDGGVTEHGRDSTIIDLTKEKPVIVREGAVKAVDIINMLIGEKEKG